MSSCWRIRASHNLGLHHNPWKTWMKNSCGYHAKSSWIHLTCLNEMSSCWRIQASHNLGLHHNPWKTWMKTNNHNDNDDSSSLNHMSYCCSSMSVVYGGGVQNAYVWSERSSWMMRALPLHTVRLLHHNPSKTLMKMTNSCGHYVKSSWIHLTCLNEMSSYCS